MLVFEEVITSNAEKGEEKKTHTRRLQSFRPLHHPSPNRRGGPVAKYELRPRRRHICPSTKLVVGLMNSQC